MRRFLVIAIVATIWMQSIEKVNAQSDPHFSMFEYARMSYNPGFAGSNQALCVTAINRQQWVGFEEGRPQTTVFSFDMPIQNISSGAGLIIIEDRIGFHSHLSLLGSFSYKIEIDYGLVSVGLGVGLLNRSIDGEWRTWNSMTGGTVYEDPLIPHMGSSTSLDLSFGAHYEYDDLYIGLSATNLLEPDLSYDMEEPSKLARHYYLIGGYSFQLPNPVYDVLPSTMIQSDGSTVQIQLNAKLLYNKSFWGGISYRYNDAIVPMVGIHLINGLSFGYSYDLVTSRIGSYTSGTHELMVRYCFSLGFDRTPGRYRSVRRL